MPAASKTRKYDKGARVMAKWPKTNLYFNGTIIDYNDTEYLVRFDDDQQSELALKFNQVSVPFTRSSRSRSRGRSPGKKSPSRKSPTRKSPARPPKSPGRPQKTPNKLSKKSPTRREKTTTDKSPEVSRGRPRRETRQVERLDTSPNVVKNDLGRKQSSRITTTYEKVTTIVDGKMNNIKVDTKSVVSSVLLKNKAKDFITRAFYCLLATLKAVPAVVMMFIPLLYTQMCTKTSCTVKQWPDIPLKSKYYFAYDAFVISGVFLLAQHILALIPFGKVLKTQQGRVRANGPIAVIASLGIIPILMHFKVNVLSVYSLYRQILMAFTVYGIVISLILYLKSFLAKKDAINPNGNTGYYIPDILHGRETNPVIWKFDVKFLLFKCSIIIWLLLTVIIVLKDVEANKGTLSPTLMTAAAFHGLYALDLIWFEDSFLTTYEYMRVGTGMMSCVMYLTVPFMGGVYTRFLLNHKTELPWYCLCGIFALYLVGYIILRGSNSQKHAYRQNPSNPALAHLESLPTSSGKRLLVSGWWGLVRHPNYFGDLIVQASMALLCGFTHAIPWLVWGFSVFFLAVRIFMVESECKKKYGLAWGSYCSRVKYRLIPKVF